MAVSDSDGRIAFPRTTLSNDTQLFAHLADIVEKERIEHVLVGDTRSHGGVDNPITQQAQAFVVALEKRFDVPVERVTELWSSIEASRYAPAGKGHDDAAAAAVILQRYLDIQRGAVE